MRDRMTDFFILEASDYVDQLERLCASEERAGQDPEALHRLTRALRGAARLHEFESIAEVAERLERAAAALRDGTRAWDDELRGRFAETAAELRVLVPAVRAWNGVMAERARAVRERWGDVGAATPPAVAAPAGEEEIVAFVASELRAVAQTVTRAVLSPDAAGPWEDALRGVIRRLGPLAGAAWLDRFAAVAELVHLLDEVTGAALGREKAPHGHWLEFYRSAVRAAADAATQVEAGAGELASEAVGALRTLAETLAGEAAGGAEEDIVSIESLFYDDEGPHVVAYGGAAEAPEEVPIEVRNFFLIEATSLIDRAQALFREGRRDVGSGEELRTALEELARTFGWFQFASSARIVRAMANSARAAVADPSLARPFDMALAELRAVVEHIDQPAEVTRRTERIAGILGAATEGGEAGAEAAADAVGPAEPEPAVPGVGEAGEAPEEEVARAEGRVAEPAAEPQPVLAAARQSAAAAEEEAPEPVIEAVPADVEPVLPITELLYSGSGALERALALAPAVDRALERGDPAALEDHLSELFDLIRLARP